MATQSRTTSPWRSDIYALRSAHPDNAASHPTR